MGKEKETLLYVETTSDDAITLIENLVRVRAARRLLEDCLFDFKEAGKTLQDLRELERKLQSEIRRTVLQPDPVRVSQHLKDRIKQHFRKEKL